MLENLEKSRTAYEKHIFKDLTYANELKTEIDKFYDEKISPLYTKNKIKELNECEKEYNEFQKKIVDKVLYLKNISE